jgi:chemotaxis protein histidine kinase CheA
MMPEDLYDGPLDATIGHNNPPPDEPETDEQRVDALVKAADTWIETVTEITDTETAKACDGFIDQLKKEFDGLEAARRAFNKPLEDQVAACNDRYRPMTALLKKASELMKALRSAWLLREKSRLAEEKRKAEAEAEAARKAAEEAAKKANTVRGAVQAEEAAKAAEQAEENAKAAAAAKPLVKGDFAAKATGLRTYWWAEIVDFDAALKHYANTESIKEIVKHLADAEARSFKGKPPIPGCLVKSGEK